LAWQMEPLQLAPLLRAEAVLSVPKRAGQQGQVQRPEA